MMGMKDRALFVLCALLAVSVSSSANAQIAVPVSSTFDLNDDGWTPVDPGEGQFGFVITGGNPGGYYRFQDSTSGSGFVRAPAKFLGDWSALDGTGSLSYDHRIFDFGGDVSAVLGFEVRLFGANGNAEAQAVVEYPPTFPPTPTDWNSVSIPIDELQWNVIQGSWAALLADIEDVHVRIEHVDNAGGRDIDGLDNILLDGPAPVPIPALTPLAISLLLTLLGVSQLSHGTGPRHGLERRHRPGRKLGRG